MKLGLALGIACLLGWPAAAQTPVAVDRRAEERPGEATALDSATADLCDRRLVLLGESGFHGDGRTAGFKADLIRRLVERCGFNAVYFESSRYDFIAISRAQRRGEPLTRDQVASAIGQLWNQNLEVQPLITFLFEQVQVGRIRLGGLDDQLGSRGMFYSLEQMPTDMAAVLPEGRREICRTRLKQRIWSSYGREDRYTEAVRTELRGCLSDIDRASASLVDPQDRADLRDMTSNFARFLDRDFLEPTSRLALRDASMFLNLQRLMEGAPSGDKTIIWAANAHVAKAPNPFGPFAGQSTFGSRVHGQYGDSAFAVGFTAAGGSFRYSARTFRDISPAPEGALEALAFAEADDNVQAVYLARPVLARLPELSGAAFDDHQQTLAVWKNHYDGLVVFRAERPPVRFDE